VTPGLGGPTLVAWAFGQAEGHPARAAWHEATAIAAALAGRRAAPWPVARVDPVLWLAAWRAGRAVWMHPAGSRGWLSSGSVLQQADPGCAPNDPAIMVPGPGGTRVFSHRALWAAVRGTWFLGAAGGGLGGAEAFVQGAASWLNGEAFGVGRRLYRHPEGAWLATDGQVVWNTRPELLGVYRRVDGDGVAALDPSTLILPDGLKSERLFDGWWRGGTVVPARFPGGQWSANGAGGIPEE
jgi:hypothetical protein